MSGHLAGVKTLVRENYPLAYFSISVIFNNYQTLLDVLENLVENPSNWDNATLTQQVAFCNISIVFCFFFDWKESCLSVLS